VRQGFLNEADQHPEQIIVIDADQEIRDVQNAIRSSCGIESNRHVAPDADPPRRDERSSRGA